MIGVAPEAGQTPSIADGAGIRDSATCVRYSFERWQRNFCEEKCNEW
jgi:hypothetical protein